jgi:hypothetical protein
MEESVDSSSYASSTDNNIVKNGDIFVRKKII